MYIIVTIPEQSKSTAKRVDSDNLNEIEELVIKRLKEKYGELRNGMRYMEKSIPATFHILYVEEP